MLERSFGARRKAPPLRTWSMSGRRSARTARRRRRPLRTLACGTCEFSSRCRRGAPPIGPHCLYGQ
eukprot:8644067-Ditylum_brightwellii.AAC.1